MKGSVRRGLAYCSLRVQKDNLPLLEEFYVNVLRFRYTDTVVEQDDPTVVITRKRFNLPNQESCGLELVTYCTSSSSKRCCGKTIKSSISHEDSDLVLTPYAGSRQNDLYWKIGILVHDVDEALNGIAAMTGNNKKSGSQFYDIGYLAHISDPANFCIELLQTTFASSKLTRKAFLAQDHCLDSPLKQVDESVVMGQITLRIRKWKGVSEDFYCGKLGMKLLSVQPVEIYGFILYFLAFTDEIPPNAENLNAVVNREWCWQRKYTTLELQETIGSSTQKSSPFSLAKKSEAGFERIVLRVTESETKALSFVGQTLEDPDGCRIYVEKGE